MQRQSQRERKNDKKAPRDRTALQMNSISGWMTEKSCVL